MNDVKKSEPSSSSVHVQTAGWEKTYRRKAALPVDQLQPEIDNLDAEVIKELPSEAEATVVAEQEEARHSGIMVALYPPLEIQDALAIEGGEPKASLHITLCYIKEHKGDTDAIRINDALKAVASDFGPVMGAIGGIGRFCASQSSDGKDVYYASYDSPIVAALQQAVVAAVEGAGLQVSRLHGYTPHITLKYLDQSEPTPSGTKSSWGFIIPKISTVSSSFRGDVPFNGARVLKYSPEFNELSVAEPEVPAMPPFTPRPAAVDPFLELDGDLVIAALKDWDDEVEKEEPPTPEEERETALEHAAIRSGAKEKIKAEPDEKPDKKKSKKKPKVEKGLQGELGTLKKGYKKPKKAPADNMVGVTVDKSGPEWKKGFGVMKVHKESSFSKEVVFKGMNKMKQIVYGVVLAPDEIDEQSDYMRAEDIEASAHDYLRKSRTVGRRHSGTVDADVVESYIAPQDLTFAEGPHGPQMVKKGSWVLGVKVHDPAEWDKVQNGEYQAFSVGGFGVRS